MMRRMWIIGLVSFLSLPFLASVSQAQTEGLPPVWNLVPQNAQAIFMIPNLQKLSEKLSIVNSDLHLDVSGLNDAIGEFKRSIGMNKGLRIDGAMLVALLDVSALEKKTPVPFIIFMPVADYGSFVSNFGGNSRDSITTITLPSGQKGYAKRVSSFAMISSTQETIANFKRIENRDDLMDQIGSASIQTINNADIAIVMLNEKAAHILKTQLTGLTDKQAKKLKITLPPPPAKDSLAWLWTYLHRVEPFLTNSQATTIGLEITKNGFKFTAAVQYKEDSKEAKLFSQPVDDQPLLDSLPDTPYLTAFSYSGAAVQSLVKMQLEQVAKDFTWLTLPINGLLPLIDQTQSAAMLTASPTSIGLGTRLVNGIFVLKTENAVTWVKKFRQYIENLNGKSLEVQVMVDQFGRELEKPQTLEIPLTAIFQENAIAIQGAKLAQYEIAYNIPPQLNSQFGKEGGVLMALLGGTGQSGYITIEGNTVIVSTSPDAQLMQKALDAIRKKKGLGKTKAIKRTRNYLLDEPAGLFFANNYYFATTTSLIMQLIKGSKLPPINADNESLPFAISFHALEGAMLQRIFIPMDIIQPTQDIIDLVQSTRDTPSNSTDPNAPSTPNKLNQPRNGPMGINF